MTEGVLKDETKTRLVRVTSDYDEWWFDEFCCSNMVMEDDIVDIYESPACKELLSFPKIG